MCHNLQLDSSTREPRDGKPCVRACSCTMKSIDHQGEGSVVCFQEVLSLDHPPPSGYLQHKNTNMHAICKTPCPKEAILDFTSISNIPAFPCLVQFRLQYKIKTAIKPLMTAPFKVEERTLAEPLVCTFGFDFDLPKLNPHFGIAALMILFQAWEEPPAAVSCDSLLCSSAGKISCSASRGAAFARPVGTAPPTLPVGVASWPS